jgi:glucans biosynthesis protein C
VVDAITIRSAARADADTAGVPARSASASLALDNLRGVVIIVVVAFHAVSAYLGSLPLHAYNFDLPPFLWRAFPIVDNHRWFGFDLFCAWQDVCLMCLMFFLSALFARPSMERKGTSAYLRDRILRLGLPWAFGVSVMMPIAVYPVYRVGASDPSFAAYVQHYLALSFWPNGPMWFLWQLLAITVLASALNSFAPRFVDWLVKIAGVAEEQPFRYFVGLTVVATIAYVPMALLFTPMAWADTGPVAVQFCRPLLYAIVYLAGLGMGARGLHRGLFAPKAKLAEHWKRWLAGAFAGYALWIGFMAWSLTNPHALWLQIVADMSFAIACISGCFGAFAVALRFGAWTSRILSSASRNAFGMFVLHYPFVVWMQYALLGTALFAIVKGTLVFAVALLCSWALSIAFRAMPLTSLLIGGERRAFHGAPRARIAATEPDCGTPHLAR